jgi:hypothetical protein
MFAKVPYPNVKYTIAWSEIGKFCTIRRDMDTGFFWIAK